MYILDKIMAEKKREVLLRREQFPEAMLQQSPLFQRQPVSLSAALRADTASGIIAEFKRRSPSKGEIRPGAVPEVIAPAYAQGGASGLSVLTDTEFFGGSTADFLSARAHTTLPMLRKDFIVDAYQLIEAKAMGADVVLLIAECLSAGEVADFARQAKDLGMEVLLEVHTADQVDKFTADIDLIGVNNRNLKTFTVDAGHSLALFPVLPEEAVKVAESGLRDADILHALYEKGYRGFLIGEWFMQQPDPGGAVAGLIVEMMALRQQK